MAQQKEFVDFNIDYDYEGTKEFGGGGFPLLPVGEGYIFDVEHLEQTTNSNNKACIAVTFVVASEQDTPELQAFAGQKAFNNYYLSEKAIGRLKQLQIACGCPGQFVASSVLGARLRADITHSESSGEPGPDGKPRESRTFANVCNERPLDESAAVAEAPPPPPPVTKAKPAAGKSANSQGAARRA